MKTGKNIKIIGIGNAGCNIINTIIEFGLSGVQFVGINTEKNNLSNCLADYKIQIGIKLNNGEGSGCNIEIGKKSALENEKEIRAALKDADMNIIVYGLCGGTGSGAGPTIANISKDLGIKTIAIVTQPFSFELTDKPGRILNLEIGLSTLNKILDNVILIPNDNLDINKDMSFKEIFKIVDKEVYLEIKKIINI